MKPSDLAGSAAAIVVLLAPCAIAQVPAPATVTQPPAFIMPPPTPNDALKSPEVKPDGTVVFRIYAPLAREVRLQEEGKLATPGLTMKQSQMGGAGYPLERADNGVWSITFGPIQPGVYRYSFLVDGVKMPDPRNPLTSESLNSVASIYEVPGSAFQEYHSGTPHGAIASVWYDSPATGSLRRMHVYSPPGYETSTAKYPVLYLLHGGGDTDDSWSTVGRAGAILDNLIAAHQAQPMIIVMPAGHVSRDFALRTGAGTMGHDAFNQELTGTILPYIDSHYRTLTDRDHRALAGLSMGGLQTLDISLTNSAQFAWIGVFSSGWFPELRDQEEKTDLAQYKASGMPFKLYWVGAGRLDIAHDNSQVTVDLLRKYGITPVTHDSAGFHAWNNWRDYLYLFAPQLFR
jgi:enterochelin esterase family protein